MIHEEIEEMRELTEIAYKLRDDSFPTLYIAVRRSLESHNVNLPLEKLICFWTMKHLETFLKCQVSCYVSGVSKLRKHKDFF